MPKIVPVGEAQSMFELPSSGSKATKRAADAEAGLRIISSSSSEAMAATEEQFNRVVLISSLAMTSIFFCTSPEGLLLVVAALPELPAIAATAR